MRTLNRDDLIEILSFDGTHQEMLEAIQDKELSMDEYENIMALLASETEEDIQKNFAKVLEDIKKAPDYNILLEDKTYWRDERKIIASEVNDLLTEMARVEKSRQEAESVIQNIESNSSIDDKERAILESAKEDLEDCIQDLREKNARVGALTLMDAEAKTYQRQLLAAERQKHMERERDVLKKEIFSVKNGIETIKHSFDVQKETNLIMKRAKHAGLHHIEDIGIAFNLQRAGFHAKEYSHATDKVAKYEIDLITRANEKAKKAYEKEHRFDKIKTLIGQEIDGTKPQIITDAKEAREYLDANDVAFSKLRTKYMEKQLDRNRRYADKEQSKLDKIIDKVQNQMNNRRVEVRSVTETMLALDEQGMFSKNGSKAEKFAHEVEEAKSRTQITSDKMNAELRDYLLNNPDRRNLLAGQKIDWTNIKGDIGTVDLTQVISKQACLNMFYKASRSDLSNEEKRQEKMQSAIKFIPDEYLKERAFTEKLIDTDWHAYSYMPDFIKADEGIALKAIDKSYGDAYFDMGDMQYNAKVAIAAHNENPDLDVYIPNEVMKSKEFKTATEKNTRSDRDWDRVL